MMQPVLLELNTAKVMDVRGVSFHLLKQELNLRLRNYLLLVNSDDARPLPKLPYPAAPARPDAQPHTIDRERRRRNNVEHTNECLHPIKLAAHIFTENRTLQVGKNNIRIHC